MSKYLLQNYVVVTVPKCAEKSCFIDTAFCNTRGVARIKVEAGSDASKIVDTASRELS